MPDETVKEISTSNFFNKSQRLSFQTWINAYSYLIDEQKDFLDYKKGFKEEIRTNEDINVQLLFPKPDISDTNYAILNEGLKLPKFKHSFPKYFETSPHVSATNLINRAGGTLENNELLEILKKTKELT